MAYATVVGAVQEKVRDAVIDFFAECGTLDGLVHSQYLLQQTDGLLRGMDEWRRSSADGSFEVLAGVGKTMPVSEPDLGQFREALKYLVSFPSRR